MDDHVGRQITGVRHYGGSNGQFRMSRNLFAEGHSRCGIEVF
jgi:hypothetical protein